MGYGELQTYNRLNSDKLLKIKHKPCKVDFSKIDWNELIKELKKEGGE